MLWIKKTEETRAKWYSAGVQWRMVSGGGPFLYMRRGSVMCGVGERRETPQENDYWPWSRDSEI
jgi:hypothetical protein